MIIIEINKKLFAQKMNFEYKSLDSDLVLGENIFKNGVFSEKGKKYFLMPFFKDISDVKSNFGNNYKEFLNEISNIILSEKDLFINIPKCLRINNNNNIFVGDKNNFKKSIKCDNCIYDNKCLGLEKNIFDAFDMQNSIFPITKQDKRLFFDLLYNYKPYFNNNEYKKTNTPIKINHYQFVLDFILSNIKKQDNILEIGCFLGMFIDFLQKIGYKSIYGLDKDKEAVNLALKYHLPIKNGDIFLDDIKFNNKYKIIIMIGVLHNDYNYGDYNGIKILDFCNEILKKVFNMLDLDSYFIFTTNKFTLNEKNLIKLGFKIIDFYKDNGDDNIFYYILKK